MQNTVPFKYLTAETICKMSGLFLNNTAVCNDFFAFVFFFF